MIGRLDAIRQHRRSAGRTVAEQIFDNARVAAGLLDDPRDDARRG